MAWRSIIPKGWSDANTAENQCHLMDAICAETVACKIKKLCKRSDLSEEKGWSLYGQETVKQVLEQGILWDNLFSALLVMNLEYQKDVTKHFKHLGENHQATLDFLKSLRQTPGFSDYHNILDFLSYWN
jgi:hypothetical protein